MTMLSLHPAFVKLLTEDQRYPLAAYGFVFESLEYAQKTLHLGVESETEPLAETLGIPESELENNFQNEPEAESDATLRQHVTGQDLCEAALRYALAQYGLLARTVLESLGIRSTSDIGNIVYNLMKIGHMRKTPADRREDFDDVFDFDTAFATDYRIGDTPSTA